MIFAYSDVSNQYVMEKASEVMAAGSQFGVMGAEQTMLVSTKPIVAVCAVRTGSGKSHKRMVDFLVLWGIEELLEVMTQYSKD